MKKQNINKVNRVSKATLSEKQSVRTTFKLGESSNDAVNWLIKTDNLKPKELFDLMCSNEKLVDVAVKASQKSTEEIFTNQIRKTFVISKRVLRLLNKISEKHELSRDLIVDNLILLFKLLIEKNAEEETKQEKEALKIISDLWSKVESVGKQLKELLNDDNPILDRIVYAEIVIGNLVSAINTKLSDDIPIDPDDMSQS